MGNLPEVLEGSTTSFYVKMLNLESLADACNTKGYAFMNLIFIIHITVRKHGLEGQYHYYGAKTKVISPYL